MVLSRISGMARAKLKAQLRRPKGVNVSRKAILEARREVWAKKQRARNASKNEAKRAKIEQIRKQHNKQSKRVFDGGALHAVHEGLSWAIEALGEKVTPLSLFMAAFAALSKSAERHQIPYLLSILTSCLPHLSQGFLQHQVQPLWDVCEQIIAEHAATDYLIATKAMKAVQAHLLILEEPTMDILRRFQALEPNKLHADTMQMYLVAFRKLLEKAALCYGLACAPDSARAPPTKDTQTQLYPLSASQKFFAQAMPHFVNLCLKNFTDSPEAVVTRTAAELTCLFNRSLSPYIVESREGQQMLDGLLSHQLLTLFKPVHQRYWGLAAELLEVLFNRLNYLKRVGESPDTDPPTSQGGLLFTERFPSVTFLLQVLNKLRVMDDAQLNGKIERALVAIGKGMTVREFVKILPFDPRAAYEAETKGDERLAGRHWATSYTLNIIRRIASHDSLSFLVDFFFPLIQFASKSAVAAERAQRSTEFSRWSALLVQYWRVAAGFCHYPRVVTPTAFRDLAKQLVGLLSNPAFVDTSATSIYTLCDGYHQLAHAEQQEEDEGSGVGRNGKDAAMADDVSSEMDDGDDDDDASDRSETRPFSAGGLPLEKGASIAAATRKKGARWAAQRSFAKNVLDEDDVFLSMNDPGWNPHKYHGISRAYAMEVCGSVFAKYSANIMPKLCNTFEHHDTTAVLRAIQSFSKVCSSNVMTNILQGILAVSSQLAAGRPRTAGQDDEGSDAAGAEPAARSAPLVSKRRVVLDIACAVAAQLPSEHVAVLFNDVIEPVLMDPAPESRLLQKKAYKLLFCIFEHRVKDIFPFFSRIIGLLSIGRQHVTTSGIKMRIRCLSWALDACKMFYSEELEQTIRVIVGEVILFSRERSSETRRLAMEMIEKMQQYLTGAGAPVNTLLHLVIAGLSGKTAMMISSAVVCMAKLVHMTQDELCVSDLVGAVALGFQLMVSAMPEVRNASMIFARMALKLAKRSAAMQAAVKESLPKLLYAIALLTSQPDVSSSTRLQMRVLLEKAIKRFGLDKVEPLFPLGSKNFLRYTQRMMRREEKKTVREERKRQARQHNEFDRFFMGVTVPSVADDAVAENLLEAGALNNFVSKHSAPVFWRGMGSGGDPESEDEHDNMHLDFKDGKLRIMTKEEKLEEDELQRRQAMADKLLRRNPRALLHADDLNTDVHSRPGKRPRDGDDTEDFTNDELVLRYGSRVSAEAAERATRSYTATHGHAVGPSANQIAKLRNEKAAKQELKRQRVEEDIRKGDEFVGRGAGDVKRGNVDPFAYVPLNRRYMNRRNNRQALQRFELVQHKSFKGEKAKAMAKS